jgi:hypothetical protein
VSPGLPVVVSSSAKTWVEHITLSEPGVDLRDPKLIITPDEKYLYLLREGASPTLCRQTRYATSMDGKVWTPLQKLLAKGDWLH